MGKLSIDGSKVLYNDETVFDFMEYTSNFSALPLSENTENELSFSSIIEDLYRKHQIISTGTLEENLSSEYLLFDAILSKKLISTSLSLRVAEIGCNTGVLSYHIATLLSNANCNSKLCCITDVIGNESNNTWVDTISQLKVDSNLSLLVSDYTDIPLPRHFFDIVIINGNIVFDKLDLMFKEIYRILKENGSLIFVCNNNNLLSNYIESNIAYNNKYELPTSICFYNANVQNTALKEKETSEWEKLTGEFLESALKVLSTNITSKTQLRFLMDRTETLLRQSIEREDIPTKLQLIRLKEQILNLIIEL